MSRKTKLIAAAVIIIAILFTMASCSKKTSRPNVGTTTILVRIQAINSVDTSSAGYSTQAAFKY